MRGGIAAAARLSAERGPGGQRIHWTHAWPVILRPTGDDRVHLVHGAGGPLGGDVLSLTVDVGAGAALSVRSAGATVVQPGPDAEPARWDTAVRVGDGGRFEWAPEPTVVTDGAGYETRLGVDLAAGAGAVVREVVVLGRHGHRGGRYRGELVVRVGGSTLLAHTTVLDGTDDALCGPAGTAGARAVGMLLLAGSLGSPGPAGSGERPRLRWAWTVLDGPGRVLIAVGDPGPVTALVDSARESVGRPDLDA